MSARLALVSGVAALLLIGICSAPAPAAETTRTAVLFDTDIGTDVDDAFALALLLASPELELCGVTTVGDAAEDRAWIACRFLSHVGADVPVAFGREAQPKLGIDWQIQYRRHPAVVWNRTARPVKQPAVEFMLEKLKAADAKVTIIAAGPLTNLAQLAARPDAADRIERIIVGEHAMRDEAAAKALAALGVPVHTVPDATAGALKLTRPDRAKLFAACTPLTFQVQALYELWDRETPVLRSVALVAAALGDRAPHAADPAALLNWYISRVAAHGEPALPKPPVNESKLITRTGLPARVHTFEDYETDIEKRWWLTGKLETKDVPTGSTRACRAVITQDYDDKMGDRKASYRAVIFNPVPGPPIGSNPRLSFRYKLSGADAIRVQLFSLSKGYHRYLTIAGLEQDKWLEGTVDMTQMRRPDGTGGPLAENERIDDIQFYIDPRAELLIDDIVLYDAAPQGESRTYPRNLLFTGWFDTGKQGNEWPGQYEIVVRDPPDQGKAASAIANPATGGRSLMIGLRGRRPTGDQVNLRFRYKVSGADAVKIALLDGETRQRIDRQVKLPAHDQWAEAEVTFNQPAEGKRLAYADALHLAVPADATLLVDDVLLYVPASTTTPAP